MRTATALEEFSIIYRNRHFGYVSGTHLVWKRISIWLRVEVYFSLNRISRLLGSC